MTLPLPHVVQDPGAQANFDAIAKQFPLSRKSLAVETPHAVGGAGEPAFQNAWVNLGGGFRSARFWKDPTGMVYVEGVVQLGGVAIGAGGTVFTLPAGYRPAEDMIFGTNSNNAHGRITVRTGGEVEASVGSNVNFSINCAFKATT